MSRASYLSLPIELSAWGLLLALGCCGARADGGHIALHATSGRYTVTLFAAPAPLVAGPCDLSLLVQSAGPEAQHDGGGAGTSGVSSENGPVVEDASVDVTLTRSLARGEVPPLTFTLTRRRGDPTPLLSTHATLPTGTYALSMTVREPGTQGASFEGQLTVGENHGRRTALLFAVLLPLAAVVLFLINQQAKRQATLRRHTPIPPVS